MKDGRVGDQNGKKNHNKESDDDDIEHENKEENYDEDDEDDEYTFVLDIPRLRAFDRNFMKNQLPEDDLGDFERFDQE
jgi:hypothetical protein